MQVTPRFGTTYRHYQKEDALAQKRALANQGIDSAVEYRSSLGLAQMINYVVHTDENGTTDLTKFRNSGQEEILE